MSASKKRTLDQKHFEHLNRFDKLNTSIPAKRRKLIRLETELKKLNNMLPKKYTNEDIHRKTWLANEIEKLREEIVTIENCTESLSYIVSTWPILVDYYNNDNIADDGIDEELMNETGGETSNKKNILSYFLKEITEDNNLTNPIKKKQSTRAKKVMYGSKSRAKLSKAKLYDNYLHITDNNHRRQAKPNKKVCSDPECGGSLIFNQNDGCIVCQTCGNVIETILIATEKPNYKEPTQDTGTYAYKRINHLTEILSQLQAKESTDIPPKIFESILRELKKRKINKDDLDIFRLRRILKMLSYRKYYEHVPHIIQIINGKEPPNFSRQDEMKIKKMFKDIQKPFSIFCPKDRKNFLNYSYVLHKFCELLDLDEYINYFPLLKNNTKLLQHDKIWKHICDYMKWKYYRSI